jgi:tetratricopeptide (TPR) repeat protein
MKKRILIAVILSATSISLYPQMAQDTSIVNAEMEMLMGNYSTALFLIQHQQQKMDINERWLQLKALAFENLNQFDSAEKIYARILEFNGNNIDATRGLARTYTAIGRVKAAVAQWERAITIDSLNRSTRLSYARLLKREGDLSRALIQYQWLIQADTCNFSHWEQIGDCAAGLGKIDVAYEAYDKAFYCNPANAPLAAKYLQFVVKSGAPPWIVIPVAEVAIKADSTYIPLVRLMGYVKYNYTKDYPSAQKWFTKAYEMGDTSKFTTKHLGITLYNNGYFTKASEMMALAFASDSTDRMLNYVLARAYIDIGERFKALELLNLNEFLILPDTMELSVIYATRGELHSRAMEYQLAIKNYERAFDLDPKSIYYLLRIGESYYGLKELKKALDYFEVFLAKSEAASKNNSNKDKLTENARANFYIEKIKKELFFLDEKIK